MTVKTQGSALEQCPDFVFLVFDLIWIIIFKKTMPIFKEKSTTSPKNDAKTQGSSNRLKK